MNVTSILSKFISEVSYENLTQLTVYNIKKCIIDTIGVSIAGSQSHVGQRIRTFINQQKSSGVCTCLGSPKTTSPSLSGLANGCMAHALDYDNLNYSVIGFPSSAVFPAVLALGEELEISGKHFIESFISGFEVACKLGVDSSQELYQRGWHTTGVLGCLGAAAACAKVFKFNCDQNNNTLSIAASQASGVRSNVGSNMKPYHVGRAAENGINAAMLTNIGFTASPNAIEKKIWFL